MFENMVLSLNVLTAYTSNPVISLYLSYLGLKKKTTTTLFSYIKYTNITPPANSKANRGRWCVDGLRFFTIVEMNK